MVTPDMDCEYWRGLLAMDAVGQLSGADRTGLRAHVDACEQCQADKNELSELVSALAMADGSALDDHVLSTVVPLRDVHPSNLDAAVLTMLSGPAADPDPTPQTHRRRRVWAGMAAAAVVVVVIGTLGIVHHGTTGSRTVALRGQGGSHGTAVLVPEAWGTSIELTDHGEHASQVLTVSMRTEYGHLWMVGSYRSVAAGELRVTLACALPIQEIERISVTDSTGQEVLHS